jgi:eukaryotic-like serine/threonine-protein kinase
VTYRPELLAAPKSTRYKISEFLGRGVTSLVYRAFDVEKNFFVALKSILFPDADVIFRMKHEFRACRGIYHPNIVEFYDLNVDNTSCFYTMELIEGVDFTRYFKGRPEHLRSCAAQLLDGLGVVHDSGRLHRDLKPSNILVEETGRTVLLDFGLAGETSNPDGALTQYHLFGGTPGYMAPERLRGEPATPATDLYAVGVILYEALTGASPYPQADPFAHYEAQKHPPPSPRMLEARAPPDLSELVLRLIAFEPTSRPQLAEARDLVEAHSGGAAFPGQRVFDNTRAGFIGRQAELSILGAAFSRVLAGDRIAALVSGVSGVGKTTLIERFIAEAQRSHDALALRSRCHHQESVSYNAVDGLIDMLSSHLAQQSPAMLKRFAPDGLPALLTTFPSLGRVAWPPLDIDPDRLPWDPQTVARESLRALQQLVRRVAVDRPLILWIDDLQWSDSGSLPLLRGLVNAGGDSAPILTILSFPADDVRSQSIAAALNETVQEGTQIHFEQIAVAPLDPAAVQELVRSLAPSNADEDAAWSHEVVQLSGGLPFFVLQLSASRPAVSLEGYRERPNAAQVLDSRLRGLPSVQRAILEIVAVSGRPIAEENLLRVVTDESATGREIYRLLNQNLLRKVEARGRGAVEIYHDRIRASVLQSLEPDSLQSRHRQIAEEMVQAKEVEHPVLVEHFLGAGDSLRASEHAVLAAREAERRLAFHRTAEFLSLAVRLLDPAEIDAALLTELAQALANSGRCAEAADLFVRVAKVKGGTGPDAIVAETHAAQLFLYSGKLSQGRALYNKIFTDLGIAFPKTVRSAQRMSLLNRAPFLLGLKRPRARSGWERRAQALARVDALWAAAKGFVMLDYVVGDAIFSRYLREAAALGEPSRLLRALALESSAMATLGRAWSLRRAASLLDRAGRMADDSGDPYDRFVVRICQAGVLWEQGRWAESEKASREAIEAHSHERGRYEFEVTIGRGFVLSALTLQGFIGHARIGNLEAIEDAKARGDVYTSRYFASSYCVYLALADDDPDEILANSSVVLEDLPTDRFTSLHWAHFVATPNAFVYAGEPWKAWALILEHWPRIQQSGFLKLGLIGAHTREIRARAALAAAAAGSPPPRLLEWTRHRLLRVAEEDAAAIGRTKVLTSAEPLAAAIRSGAAKLTGDEERRRSLLELATVGFGQCGMRLHKFAAELQLVEPAGREDSAAWRGLGEEARRPDRFAAFLMCAN